jgi:hypothetical protein
MVITLVTLHSCYYFTSISTDTTFPNSLQCAETNQGKIVEAGGLTSLLMLLRSSEDETIHRVAAGAIANLAMNGKLFKPMTM